MKKLNTSSATGVQQPSKHKTKIMLPCSSHPISIHATQSLWRMSGVVVNKWRHFLVSSNNNKWVLYSHPFLIFLKGDHHSLASVWTGFNKSVNVVFTQSMDILTRTCVCAEKWRKWMRDYLCWCHTAVYTY